MIVAMLDARLEQQFIDSADCKYQLAQGLVAPLSAAVDALMARVTAGGKVWCVGAGLTAALADYASHLLLAGFERQRPALAAQSLNAGDGDSAETLQRRLRAWASADDVLLVIGVARDEAVLVPLVDLAQDLGLTVIALVGGEAADLLDALLDTDVVISIEHPRLCRVLELQHMAVHALCDGLDAGLLGDEYKE